MGEGPLLKNILLYTMPIILTSLLQLLVNAADLVVVGRECGKLSVAAVGATGSLINLLVNSFLGLSIGAGVRISQAYGAGDDNSARETVHTAIPASAISGIVLTAVVFFFSRTFLGWMGTPEDCIELSALYMRIYAAGIVFNVIYNFAAAILRAVGDTKSPLIFLTIAGIVNVVLNIFFVKAFDMDVAGVALATSISQFIACVLTVAALIKRKDACHLDLRKMRIRKTPLVSMLAIGIPAAIQGSLFAISNVIIQAAVNSFGSTLLSGNSAAGNIEGFIFTIMYAFSTAAVNFIGYNYGAGNYKRIKQIALVCIGCVIVVGLALGCFAFFFRRQLLSIYIPGEEEAIYWGMLRMCFTCIPYVLCGMLDVVTGCLRGLGSSTVPMGISVVGVCGFRLAWLYSVFTIGKYHNIQTLLISYPISWAITLIAEAVAFAVVYSKKRRRYENTVDAQFE